MSPFRGSPRIAIRFASFVALLMVTAGSGSAGQHRFEPEPGYTKGNFRNDIVYYIMIDRFHDGEAGNNIPHFAYPDDPSLSANERAFRKLNRAMLPLMYDPTRSCMGLYFGGDLEGVRKKLPYLADLGVTQVILSPIMENTNGLFRNDANYFLRSAPDQTIPEGDYQKLMTAYHGYWTRDWWRIEEHFRSPKDPPDDPMGVFRRLLNDAKRLGIGILLDITLNQTSPIPDTFIGGGNVYASGKEVSRFDLDAARRSATGYYHRYFPINFSSPSKLELEHGTLPGGMPDLNQGKAEVSRYLLDAALFWLEFNKENGASISGFRVDAIKHVDTDFWKVFENTILARNPEAILIGEYFSGGYFNKPSMDFVDQTHFFSIYDFDLSIAAKRFFARDRKWEGRAYVIRKLLLGEETLSEPFAGRLIRKSMNPGDILEVPESTARRIDQQTAAEWFAFVDNHDLPRVRTEYGDMSDTSYLSMLSFLFAIPRVPSLLYGTETGLAIPPDPRHRGLFGTGGDPFNRQMMVFPGEPGWSQSIYDHVKKLIAFRKANPVLRYGRIELIFPEEASRHNDLFFLRRAADPDAKPKVLFAYRSEGGETRLVQSELETDRITDIQTDDVIRADASGAFHVQFARDAARVFSLE